MKTVAVLVERKYEDLELWYPVFRLQEAGFSVLLVGCGEREYFGKVGLPCRPDVFVETVRQEDLAGLVIPGGYAPERLRLNSQVVELVQNVYNAGKMLAAICHGPQVLISAGVLRKKRVTGYPGIWDDLRNAGATVVDEPVVVDERIVTSRVPQDLPFFGRALLEALNRQ